MSNKKNLLNESQVRQFMKLAKLEPLTPGFVNGLTERANGEDLEEGTDEELGESSARGSNEYSKPGHHKGGGVKSGGEPIGEVRYRDEEEELGSELDATEDELGAEDALADEEGADLEDMEGEEAAAPAEPNLTVRQVVDAIEAALEELLPNEEVDAEYIGDDDMDVEAEDEFAPEGDEVVADIEVGDEEELEEALGFGQSADEKRKKLALGKKGSYTPDPEAGEKDYTPTPEEAAKARADAKAKGPTSSRDKFERRPGTSGRTAGTGAGYGFEEGLTANTDDLVEQITKRVAARILKAALLKK